MIDPLADDLGPGADPINGEDGDPSAPLWRRTHGGKLLHALPAHPDHAGDRYRRGPPGLVTDHALCVTYVHGTDSDAAVRAVR